MSVGIGRDWNLLSIIGRVHKTRIGAAVMRLGFKVQAVALTSVAVALGGPSARAGETVQSLRQSCRGEYTSANFSYSDHCCSAEYFKYHGNVYCRFHLAKIACGCAQDGGGNA